MAAQTEIDTNFTSIKSKYSSEHELNKLYNFHHPGYKHEWTS